ncbi:MAG: response regulator, partial [Candidatus Neomarinimicrobiota bacterium]
MTDPQTNGFQLSVLVVDDEPSICSFLDDILSMQGYAVEEACDGAQALEKLKERDFHLAIIDLTLPDLNGFNLVKQAKELQPDLVAVIMTGMDLDSYSDLIKYDVDDYITKPFSVDHLTHIAAKYEKFLNRWYTDKELRENLEREKRKSAFFNQAGHQLKSPIAVIKEFVHLFTEGFGGSLNAKQTQYLEAIDHNVNHLLYLVESIENLARVDSGTWKVRLESENPRQIISRVSGSWGPILDMRNLKLVTEMPSDLPAVQADAAAVEQVLINLIDNASKYSTPGSTVTLRCKAVGDRLICFELENQGSVIPPDQHEK